jgi:hypothetical protein
MPKISTGSCPDGALISKFVTIPGTYADCFFVDVSKSVTLSAFIQVFFNTPVFRLERLLLALSPSGRSTDQDIADLASGTGDTMAIWKVEARNANQVIMSVRNGPIRTWLMVVEDHPIPGYSRLYFGSAVLPTQSEPDGQPKQGPIFRMFTGFHTCYSRVLLWMAARRLDR